MISCLPFTVVVFLTVVGFCGVTLDAAGFPATFAAGFLGGISLDFLWGKNRWCAEISEAKLVIEAK